MDKKEEAAVLRKRRLELCVDAWREGEMGWADDRRRRRGAADVA